MMKVCMFYHRQDILLINPHKISHDTYIDYREKNLYIELIPFESSETTFSRWHVSHTGCTIFVSWSENVTIYQAK